MEDEKKEIEEAAKAAKLMHYSSKLSKAIQKSVTNSRLNENADEENELFFEMIKSRTPAIIKGQFLQAEIISVHLKHFSFYYV